MTKINIPVNVLKLILGYAKGEFDDMSCDEVLIKNTPDNMAVVMNTFDDEGDAEYYRRHYANKPNLVVSMSTMLGYVLSQTEE